MLKAEGTLTALFSSRACSNHLLNCIQPLINAASVCERVSDPVAQEAAAKGCLGVVHQPKQRPLLTTIIIVAQHLQLSVSTTAVL